MDGEKTEEQLRGELALLEEQQREVRISVFLCPIDHICCALCEEHRVVVSSWKHFETS